MGVQERKARQKQELRQDILDAATELFVEEGFDSVSMRKIADRIEYSPATIYLHFRDKDDLLDNICADTFVNLLGILESLANEHPDPVDGLRAGLRAYIGFGLEHPNHYRVTFMTAHWPNCETGTPCRSDETGERAFSFLRDGVAACVQAGQFRSVDLEVTSQTLWAAIHGLTSLLITCSLFPWADREVLIDSLLDTLIGGLRIQ
ncbi:MAG: TetR/AcrR family transcriptional regulator [Bryobacteraceae bacterium]|nr:TetR/AcrR family transcriptional regulator [Bryobacteraceae bacterium]